MHLAQRWTNYYMHGVLLVNARSKGSHAGTADSFKFGQSSIPPKQAKAKRNAPSVRGPPDTESCMKCDSVAFTSDDPIFFCATCVKGKPGIHLSCAREVGFAVPLDGDVTQDEFVFQCNACRRLPTKGEKPLIMNVIQERRRSRLVQMTLHPPLLTCYPKCKPRS